ncbi:MAG: ribonuclease H-like domain-containing protein [Alphaproteobacteria bacterium]|nr:ribonuclease H-like domain-containing protein [Alphaproteobacteria bacterium]MBN2675537.1 ribonuclease H-like domain-containing protein [Alphaproteobacteria bacterium]
MKRIICFDIETTGFEYTRGDRVIEIGAVELIDGRITENSFHEYINPDGKIIPPDSYMVHKLSNAFLEDKPKIAAIAPRLLEFIGDSPVVAHNGIDFDFPFINYELAQLGLTQIGREKQLDSIVIARNKIFGPKTYTLDSLAKWFGVSLTARADAHGALIDAEILAKVFLELENTAPARNIKDIINEQHEAFLKHPKIGQNFPRRQFTPSEEEILNHADFIKCISV